MKDWILVLACLLICAGLYCLDLGTGPEELLVSPPAPTGPLPTSPGRSEPGAQSSDSAPQAKPEKCSSELTAGDPDSIPAFQLAQYEDSFLPTEEGLWDMTVSLWLNQDFLELTEDEAHEILALDDFMGLRGPGSFLSVVGPLPTREDCSRAFRSEKVKVLLREVCSYEVVLCELGSIPNERRAHWTSQRIQETIRMRDQAMIDLMQACEEATGVTTWRTWLRCYRRWSE